MQKRHMLRTLFPIGKMLQHVYQIFQSFLSQTYSEQEILIDKRDQISNRNKDILLTKFSGSKVFFI